MRRIYLKLYCRIGFMLECISISKNSELKFWRYQLKVKRRTIKDEYKNVDVNNILCNVKTHFYKQKNHLLLYGLNVYSLMNLSVCVTMALNSMGMSLNLILYADLSIFISTQK